MHCDTESTRIPAHRLLLAATSPVFAKLLYPPPAPIKTTGESKEEKYATSAPAAAGAIIDPATIFTPLLVPLEINLTTNDHLTADVFRELLRAVYSDKVDLTTGVSLKLLQGAARHYQVTKVIQMCKKATTSDLTLTNCLQTLTSVDPEVITKKKLQR